MKKFNQFAIICLVFTALMGCGGNKQSTDTSADEYNSYQDACRELNFDAAHDSLDVYRNEYIEAQSKGAYDGREEIAAAKGKYYNAFDYIYKAEVQYLLSEVEGEDCKDKIIFLLESIPVDGQKLPEGVCDDDVVDIYSDESIPLYAYIAWTHHYNSLCNNILKLAINRKNQELAKQTLLQFVDNVNIIQYSFVNDMVVDGVEIGVDQGYIKYSSEDRDKAKAQYDAAVENGAFE